MKDEAIAHFTMAAQYDPYLDAPRKHLGYVKRHGRWMTREKIAAEEQEATAQRKADRYWEPLFRKWKSDLRESRRRQDAEKSLAKVTDPRAVPSIVRSFAGGTPDDQLRATRDAQKDRCARVDQGAGPPGGLECRGNGAEDCDRRPEEPRAPRLRWTTDRDDSPARRVQGAAGARAWVARCPADRHTPIHHAAHLRCTCRLHTGQLISRGSDG